MLKGEKEEMFVIRLQSIIVQLANAPMGSQATR